MKFKKGMIKGIVNAVYTNDFKKKLEDSPDHPNTLRLLIKQVNKTINQKPLQS